MEYGFTTNACAHDAMRYADAIITFRPGRSFRSHWPSATPSITPGMRMSVNTRSTATALLNICTASSPLAASKTVKPFARSSSVTHSRTSISSSATRIVGAALRLRGCEEMLEGQITMHTPNKLTHRRGVRSQERRLQHFPHGNKARMSSGDAVATFARGLRYFTDCFPCCFKSHRIDPSLVRGRHDAIAAQ